MKRIAAIIMSASLCLTGLAFAEKSIDYLALVNKLHPLPDGWEEALQTVTITNSVGDKVEVEKKAYEAWLQLKADLEENDGIYPELDSAYLIDRHGAGVTRREAFAVLWEDRAYDLSMQKQLDVVIRSMRATLEEYGVSEIFDMRSGAMRVRPDLISCDAWRYLAGDPEAIRSFRGEYMSNYSWASFTESRIALDGGLTGGK